MLQRVNELTGGNSLASNIALVMNNAEKVFSLFQLSRALRLGVLVQGCLIGARDRIIIANYFALLMLQGARIAVELSRLQRGVAHEQTCHTK